MFYICFIPCNNALKKKVQSFNLAIACINHMSLTLFNIVQNGEHLCKYSQILANAMDAEKGPLYSPNQLIYGMSSVITAFSSVHYAHCLR